MLYDREVDNNSEYSINEENKLQFEPLDDIIILCSEVGKGFLLQIQCIFNLSSCMYQNDLIYNILFQFVNNL